MPPGSTASVASTSTPRASPAATPTEPTVEESPVEALPALKSALWMMLDDGEFDEVVEEICPVDDSLDSSTQSNRRHSLSFEPSAMTPHQRDLVLDIQSQLAGARSNLQQVDGIQRSPQGTPTKGQSSMEVCIYCCVKGYTIHRVKS